MILILAVRLRHYLAMPAIATSALGVESAGGRKEKRRRAGRVATGPVLPPGGRIGARTVHSDWRRGDLAGPMGGQVTVEVPTPSTSLTQF